MKKLFNRKDLVIGLLCGSCLIMVQTSAATVGEVNTESDVTFTAPGVDEEGPVIKPGTPDDKIEPEGGGQTKGPLRISHVPDIHFGTHKISSDIETSYTAINERYQEIDISTGLPKDTKLSIPHFVQVVDERGEIKNAEWQLLVKATTFKSTKPEVPELTGTYIGISEEKIFNNVLNDTEIKDSLFGFDLTQGIKLSENAIEILGVNKDKHTSATKTSAVFNNDYNSDKEYHVDNDYEKDSRNSGVKLHTFAKDVKLKNEVYTSRLTWTLNDAL